MGDDGAAIALLAAGQGRRFGGAKLDAECAGRPLGSWAARCAEAAGFARRIVVVGDPPPAFVGDLDGWTVVANPDAASGLSSSVRRAAGSAGASTRLVIALADMPLLRPAHLARLRACAGIAFTAYPDGGRGVPAGFPRRCFDRLAQLRTGAAEAEWGEDAALVAPEHAGDLGDVDRPEDLARVALLLNARRGWEG